MRAIRWIFIVATLLLLMSTANGESNQVSVSERMNDEHNCSQRCDAENVLIVPKRFGASTDDSRLGNIRFVDWAERLKNDWFAWYYEWYSPKVELQVMSHVIMIGPTFCFDEYINEMAIFQDPSVERVKYVGPVCCAMSAVNTAKELYKELKGNDEFTIFLVQLDTTGTMWKVELVPPPLSFRTTMIFFICREDGLVSLAVYR